jgi:hypothetical protein
VKGEQNALRHALWQVLLTCQFDSDTARDIGDIHEDTSSDPCDTAIDQFNNGHARAIAQAMDYKPFEGDYQNPLHVHNLSESLLEAIRRGDFVKGLPDARVSPPCP